MLYHGIPPQAYAANYIGTKLDNVTKKEEEKSSSSFLYLRQLQKNQNEDWTKMIFD